MSFYSDYSDFDRTYFVPDDINESFRSGYWNYPPSHVDYNTFASQVADVTGQSKVLVVGCATGIALRAMRVDQGIDRAFGMEYSQWAVDNALSDVRDEVYQGDARNQNRFNEIAHDVQGPPRWDGIYTEFVLSHYDNEQAIQIYNNCLEETDDVVIHRIWSGTGKTWELEEFNLHTINEWISIVGDHDNVEWIDYDRPEDNTI